MKITIKSICNDEAIPEGIAAKKLRDMLSASISNQIDGQIYIVPNVHIDDIRTTIDVDFVIWGNLSDCKLPYYYSENDIEPKKDLLVKDFFVVMELKKHMADRISCNDSHLFVEYTGRTQDVTEYLDNQQKSLADYIGAEGMSVYVSKAIWLSSMTKDNLDKLALGHNMGILPKEFTFKDLIDVIIADGIKPKYDADNNCYVLSAINKIQYDSQLNNLLLLPKSSLFDDMIDEDEPDSKGHNTRTRTEDAEAMAKNYFYYRKNTEPYYWVTGAGGVGFSDDNEGFVNISDVEVARIKQIVIDTANSQEGSTKSINSFKEALEIVQFRHLFRTNNELFNMLQERLNYIDIGLPDIDFSIRYYDIKFSVICYNYRDNSLKLPINVYVKLTEEEYLSLLENVLIHQEGYTYNCLMIDNPGLVSKIYNALMYDYEIYDMPYIILFDEALEDAKVIGPLPEEQVDDDYPFSEADPDPDDYHSK